MSANSYAEVYSAVAFSRGSNDRNILCQEPGITRTLPPVMDYGKTTPHISYEDQYLRSLEEIRQLRAIIHQQKMEIQELKSMVYQHPNYWMPTKICQGCSTPLSQNWYSYHSDSLCQICHESRSAKTLPDVPNQCIICKASESSNWHFQTEGNVCEKCHLKCHQCSSTSRTRFVNGNYICQRCELTKKPVKMCGDCGVTKSSCWYKDRKKQAGHLCRRCYTQQNLTRIDVLPDGTIQKRACVTCNSHETTSWYNDPEHVGKFNCIRCYQKRRVRTGKKSPKSSVGSLASDLSSQHDKSSSQMSTDTAPNESSAWSL
jgi:hypothetical protein